MTVSDQTSQQPMLSRINEFVLFLALLIAFLPVMELGFRLGLRHQNPVKDGVKEHIKSLQSALLGLLSLLLGFNFVMASSRFEARKALIQEEVNSIGAIWSRSQLLPPAKSDELSGLLRRYVGARIDFMRAGTDKNALEAANAKTSEIDAEIWGLTRGMVRENTGGPSWGFLFSPSMRW